MVDNDETSVASAAEGEPAPDSVKNLKSEFSRKFENVNKLLEDQNKQFAQLTQMIVAQQAQAQAAAQTATKTPSTSELKDLMYDKPEEFINQVVDRAAKAADSRIQQQNTYQAEESRTINTLRADYPELDNPGSEIYKRTLDIYNQIPQSQRGPIAIKAAAREAAAELGVLPVSKRVKQRGEEDIISGGDAGGSDEIESSRGRDRSGKSKKLDPRTVAFAEALGRPVNDPKYMERLQKFNQRPNWRRFKGE